MSGTKAGGLLAARLNKERHGDDYYVQLGRKGGSTNYGAKKGFAAMPVEHRIAAGAKGGAISKRRPHPEDCKCKSHNMRSWTQSEAR